MAEGVQTDFALLIEKEILASHEREWLILKALDSSYGLNYSSRHLKKRPYDDRNNFPNSMNSGAKTMDSEFETDERQQKRLCTNSNISHHRKSVHEK